MKKGNATLPFQSLHVFYTPRVRTESRGAYEPPETTCTAPPGARKSRGKLWVDHICGTFLEQKNSGSGDQTEGLYARHAGHRCAAIERRSLVQDGNAHRGRVKPVRPPCDLENFARTASPEHDSAIVDGLVL